MLIERLKVSGLLSFGTTGIDLPLGNLNVLIGPNGSGKSNFLEVLALLHAAPTRLATPIKDGGGIGDWLWKGPVRSKEATIEALVDGSRSGLTYSHSLVLGEHGGRVELLDETIGRVVQYRELEGIKLHYHYRFARGNPELRGIPAINNEIGDSSSGDMQLQEEPVLYSTDSEIRRLDRSRLRPEESILSQIRDPERYPALTYLAQSYEKIRLYSNWSFGPDARIRQGAPADEAGDFLLDGGGNLPLVLSNFTSDTRAAVVAALQELYEGIEGYQLPVNFRQIFLYIEEQGKGRIPASRLSDGTLRYLCLLAILLHPDPPPLIAIDEPELGLHPDIVPTLAKLLVVASERTQLIVTTHSRLLVDALTDHPDSIIVCEKIEGESHFRRLSAEKLTVWLERYSLGELWSMGEIGGNRW